MLQKLKSFKGKFRYDDQEMPFLEHLDEFQASLRGVVINRMHPWPGASQPSRDLAEGVFASADLDRLSAALGDRAAATAAVSAAVAQAREAVRGHEHTRSLSDHAAQQNCFFRSVPEQARDIRDLDGLSSVATALLLDDEAAYV